MQSERPEFLASEIFREMRLSMLVESKTEYESKGVDSNY